MMDSCGKTRIQTFLVFTLIHVIAGIVKSSSDCWEEPIEECVKDIGIGFMSNTVDCSDVDSIPCLRELKKDCKGEEDEELLNKEILRIKKQCSEITPDPGSSSTSCEREQINVCQGDVVRIIRKDMLSKCSDFDSFPCLKELIKTCKGQNKGMLKSRMAQIIRMCRYNHRYGVKAATLKVKVELEPSVLHKLVNPGDGFAVWCTASTSTGDHPQLKWVINGQTVTSYDDNTRVNVEDYGDSYPLLINNIRYEDGGRYECIGTYDGQTNSKYIDIEVNATNPDRKTVKSGQAEGSEDISDQSDSDKNNIDQSHGDKNNTDQSDGDKNNIDQSDGDKNNIYQSDDDKNKPSECVIGNARCSTSTVKSYINGRVHCCHDNRQLSISSSCGRDGENLTSCTCSYLSPMMSEHC